MKLVLTLLLVIVTPLWLASCGTLPQPFLGKPGPEGAILSIPPPPILIVPPPHLALLGNNGPTRYAGDIAAALVKRGVPSVAGPASTADWQLRIKALQDGPSIVPAFEIIGPNQKVYGKTRGSPTPYAAWVNGDPAVLSASAHEASEPLAQLLASINAKIQQSNPASLENRPAHVMLSGVHGAPGDGDHSLALDFGRSMAPLGVVFVTTPSKADFIVTGTVTITPQGPGKELAELDWVVRDRTGRFIGKVSQLHLLNPTDIEPYWGDVAAVAAKQAALGVQQVVQNATLKPVSAASSEKAPIATLPDQSASSSENQTATVPPATPAANPAAPVPKPATPVLRATTSVVKPTISAPEPAAKPSEPPLASPRHAPQPSVASPASPVTPGQPHENMLQLAALPTKEGALQAWHTLAKKAPQLLSGRTPVIVPAVVHGTNFFQVRLSFPTRADAAEFCSRLRSSGIACYQPRS